MRTKELLHKLDHGQIVKAIRDAEAKTTAHIRVYLHRGTLKGDVLAAATDRFQRLKLHHRGERNSVLIFIAARSHKFAVVGDQAIHERCGETYWQRMVEQMRRHFREDRFSIALVEAIESVGGVLAEHFPKNS